MALVTPNTQIAAINASRRSPRPSGAVFGRTAKVCWTSGSGLALGSAVSEGWEDGDGSLRPKAADPEPDELDDPEVGGT